MKIVRKIKIKCHKNCLIIIGLRRGLNNSPPIMEKKKKKKPFSTQLTNLMKTHLIDTNQVNYVCVCRASDKGLTPETKCLVYEFSVM